MFPRTGDTSKCIVGGWRVASLPTLSNSSISSSSKSDICCLGGSQNRPSKLADSFLVSFSDPERLLGQPPTQKSRLSGCFGRPGAVLKIKGVDLRWMRLLGFLSSFLGGGSLGVWKIYLFDGRFFWSHPFLLQRKSSSLGGGGPAVLRRHPLDCGQPPFVEITLSSKSRL